MSAVPIYLTGCCGCCIFSTSVISTQVSSTNVSPGAALAKRPCCLMAVSCSAVQYVLDALTQPVCVCPYWQAARFQGQEGRLNNRENR